MRQADPNSKIGRLRQALLDAYHQHRRTGALPTSVRFLYYELTGAGVVSKADARGSQDVSAALMDLREAGLVAWEDISDETRTLSIPATARSIKQYMIDALRHAYLSPWQGRPPLVLCESRSLSGVLHDLVFNTFLAGISATNGQCGGFLHTDLGPSLSPGDMVLYLGDFDLAGMQIEAHTRTTLEGLIGGSLEWERLALTERQVERYHLTPIIKLDKRYKPPRRHEAVETEALSQSVIVDIVEKRLVQLIHTDGEPLSRIQVREKRQRAKILRALEAVR